MGNLICCAGESNNKRGGTNVKTLLRKTEKPGKRRRIDDLVRDVLKKERRKDYRQNRKREKKGANRLSQEEHGTVSHTGTNMSSEEKIEEIGNIVNKDDEKEETPKESHEVASSNSGVSLKESFEDKSDAQNQLNDQSSISDVSEISEKQPGDCTSLMSVHSISETESSPESSVKSICERGSLADDAYNDEPEDSQRSKGNQAGTRSEVGEVRRILSDDNKVADASEAEVQEYFEENARDTETPLNACEAEHTVKIKAEDGAESNTSKMQIIVTAATADTTAEENATDNQSENEKESSTESTLSYETAIISETDEPKHDSQLQKDQDVSKCDEYAESESGNQNCENADKLSDSSDESKWDLDEAYEDLIAEIPVESCESNNEHVERSTRLNKGKQQNDDDHDENTVDAPRVHDANKLSGSDQDVTMTNNEDNLDVPEVHDAYNTPEYDNTKLRHNIENDKESFRPSEELKVKNIPRACPVSSKLMESSTYLENTKRFPSVSGINDVGAFKNQIQKFGPSRIDILPNTRSIVYNNKITLQKKLLGQSVTKYGGMDSMMIGGQKPQLRQIERLKQDSFDFPPKFRQHTEQDRHGSIADLKWSRHMRPKARKNKRMSKFELEELMFLNNGASPHHDEF